MYLSFSLSETTFELFLPKNYKRIFMIDRKTTDEKSVKHLLIYIPFEKYIEFKKFFPIISKIKLKIPEINYNLETKDISVIFYKGQPFLFKIVFLLRNNEEKFPILAYFGKF